MKFWKEAQRIAGLLLLGGQTKDEAAQIIAGAADDALDFDDLVPGVAGDVMEAVDGPIILGLVLLALHLVPEAKLHAAARGR